MPEPEGGTHSPLLITLSYPVFTHCLFFLFFLSMSIYILFLDSRSPNFSPFILPFSCTLVQFLKFFPMSIYDLSSGSL